MIGTGPGLCKKKIVIVMITRKGCLGDEIGIMIGECDVNMVVRIRISFGMQKITETRPNQKQKLQFLTKLSKLGVDYDLCLQTL